MKLIGVFALVAWIAILVWLDVRALGPYRWRFRTRASRVACAREYARIVRIGGMSATAAWESYIREVGQLYLFGYRQSLDIIFDAEMEYIDEKYRVTR